MTLIWLALLASIWIGGNVWLWHESKTTRGEEGWGLFAIFVLFNGFCLLISVVWGIWALVKVFV